MSALDRIVPNNTIQNALAAGSKISLRETLVKFYKDYLGDIGSGKLHADLKPWAATLKRINDQTSLSLEFADLVVLDSFPQTLAQLKGDRHLSDRVVNEFNAIYPQIHQHVENSSEAELLKSIKSLVQTHGKDMREIMDALDSFGGKFEGVKACINQIRKYRMALASLVPMPCADADYDPHMGLMLGEIAKPDSPLHDMNLHAKKSMFDLASDIFTKWDEYPHGGKVTKFTSFLVAANKIEIAAKRIAAEARKLQAVLQI